MFIFATRHRLVLIEDTLSSLIVDSPRSKSCAFIVLGSNFLIWFASFFPGAVTLYDNAQNKGITDYDEEFNEKKMGGMMSMPEDKVMQWDSGASTDNFAKTKYGVQATNMGIGAAWSTFIESEHIYRLPKYY